MRSFVVDTHSLLWYLTASPRLSRRARSVFKRGEEGKAKIIIPSIVLAELYFLLEKLRVDLDFESEYKKIVEAGQFKIVPLSGEDVLIFKELSGIREIHDRIIVGVAYKLKIPLVTRDKEIWESGIVKVIW